MDFRYFRENSEGSDEPALARSFIRALASCSITKYENRGRLRSRLRSSSVGYVSISALADPEVVQGVRLNPLPVFKYPIKMK